MSKPCNPETQLRQDILGSIGALPGLMIWINKIGVAEVRSGGKITFGGPAGSADLIGCYYGTPVGLEIKTPTGRQSDVQRAWERAWSAVGGFYAVVRSPDEALAALEESRSACQPKPNNTSSTAPSSGLR